MPDRTHKSPPRVWGPWRKINPDWWHAHGLGSAYRLASGWWASDSAYPQHGADPVVGPYLSARAARDALEVARG